MVIQTDQEVFCLLQNQKFNYVWTERFHCKEIENVM
jgi:hypothetical protein